MDFNALKITEKSQQIFLKCCQSEKGGRSYPILRYQASYLGYLKNAVQIF
jgi:hypothetical protein